MSDISTKQIKELLDAVGYTDAVLETGGEHYLFSTRGNGRDMAFVPDYYYSDFEEEDVKLFSLAPALAQEVISLREKIEQINNRIESLVQDYYQKTADASEDLGKTKDIEDQVELEKFRDMCHLMIDQLKFVGEG